MLNRQFFKQLINRMIRVIALGGVYADYLNNYINRIPVSSRLEITNALLYIPNRLDLFDLVFLLAAVDAGADDLALLLGFSNQAGFFVSPLPVANIVGRMFGGGDVHLG
jgi:hypothetical protein